MLSSKIQTLQNQLAANPAQKSAILETFWQAVIAHNTPYFEPLADDAASNLVTFVWQADSQTQSVALFSHLLHSQAGFAATPLLNLPATDVWYFSQVLPQNVMTLYWFSVNDVLAPLEAPDDWKNRKQHFSSDPFNPQSITLPARDETSPAEVYSVLLGLAIKTPAWNIVDPTVSVGCLTRFTFESKILENSRAVWVYTPAGYPAAEPYGLALLFDGWLSINSLPTITILDNLIAAKKIAPLLVIMPDYAQPQDRATELACNSKFTDFLVKELLPWARDNYRLGTNPAKNLISGISYGGLAAVYTALSHPELFGNVLSQSGSFWWGLPDNSNPEWLTQQVNQLPLQPLNFYLSVGKFESDPAPTGISMLAANRHLQEVLLAKNYPIHYVEFNGCHDFVCWRTLFAEALLALLGN